jgi:TonB family protein
MTRHPTPIHPPDTLLEFVMRPFFALALFLLVILPPKPAGALAPDAKRVLLTQVPPAYPELAKKMHLEGTVILQITIRSDGKIGTVAILAGHPLLRGAAENAVHQWRYTPAPEETVSTVQVNFQLTK